MRAPVFLVVAVAAAAWGVPQRAVWAQATTHAGQYELADIEYGARLYASHCVACHGENGDLMPQINLRGGRFPNAPTDRELGTLIREGLPGTAMTPNEYTPSEITALVAYVRNIGSFSASDALLGDSARGEALFNGRGECATCHRVGGAGPRFAPDLTAVGAVRTAAALERALVGGQNATLPINKPVRIVTNRGEQVTGRRLNEDTFTVQVVDEQQRLRSFDKTTLRELTVLDEPLMPSYADAFDERERADIVSYLLTLKGTAR
jgi:putative heme-binding domain-containing protein